MNQIPIGKAHQSGILPRCPDVKVVIEVFLNVFYGVPVTTIRTNVTNLFISTGINVIPHKKLVTDILVWHGVAYIPPLIALPRNFELCIAAIVLGGNPNL